MPVLWAWIGAVVAEITAALALLGRSPAAQRTWNLISAYAEDVAAFASRNYDTILAMARQQGYIINRDVLWVLAKQATDTRWVDIERYLIENNVTREVIQRLYSQMVSDVTVRILNAHVPPNADMARDLGMMAWPFL